MLISGYNNGMSKISQNVTMLVTLVQQQEQ